MQDAFEYVGQLDGSDDSSAFSSPSPKAPPRSTAPVTASALMRDDDVISLQPLPDRYAVPMLPPETMHASLKRKKLVPTPVEKNALKRIPLLEKSVSLSVIFSMCIVSMTSS